MELTPDLLLFAYSRGIFPMAHEGGEIYWYDPDPRAILPLDRFHVSRSLARTIRRGHFTIRVNSAFEPVMRACAAPGPGREETWISEEIVTAYCKLHRLGYAHSVEAWADGELVGGLYGVALGGLFAGESMFSLTADASKVALFYLAGRLKTRGFALLDIQFITEHFRRLGAVEVSRRQYQTWLVQALRLTDVHFA